MSAHDPQVLNHNVDDYFSLLKILSTDEKLKLISKISDSITENNQDEINFFSCFGKFHSSKSADEIINEIYSSRQFNKNDIQL